MHLAATKWISVGLFVALKPLTAVAAPVDVAVDLCKINPAFCRGATSIADDGISTPFVQTIPSLPGTPIGDGTLTLNLNGDFGANSEFVDVIIDGESARLNDGDADNNGRFQVYVADAEAREDDSSAGQDNLNLLYTAAVPEAVLTRWRTDGVEIAFQFSFRNHPDATTAGDPVNGLNSAGLSLSYSAAGIPAPAGLALLTTGLAAIRARAGSAQRA